MARHKKYRPRGVSRKFAADLMLLKPNDGKSVLAPTKGTTGGVYLMVGIGIEVATGRKFRSYSTNGSRYYIRVK